MGKYVYLCLGCGKIFNRKRTIKKPCPGCAEQKARDEKFVNDLQTRSYRKGDRRDTLRGEGDGPAPLPYNLTKSR